jgi:putative transposase
MAGEPRKAYPSDLTDEQWELIEPLIPKQRRSKKGGRPRTVDMREVLNTIFYQCRSGCQWDMLPHDLLPKSTVYDYFAKWRDDGTLRRINETLVGAIRGLEAPSEPRSTAKPSNRASAAKAEDTMAARKSRAASEISPWIPWACCSRSR